MKKILLIEDEYEIRRHISKYLEKEGFIVYGVSHAEEGIDYMNRESIDFILLDLMLPKMQGSDFLEELKKKNCTIPTIVISALSDELVQYNAFELMVDDYVVKPFSMNILTCKIKAILRRSDKDESTDKIIRYDKICLYVDNYRVLADKEELILTAKEFELLQLLLLNVGRVFTREEILTLIWGYDYFGDARNIDVHVKNLRKKLPRNYITTIKGVGYRIEEIGK